MENQAVEPLGTPWYETTISDRPQYLPLSGSQRTDVIIIGGGFTGLAAAVELAHSGTQTILIEKHRLGSGASGRNGGQLGTGQRVWPADLEQQFGFTRAKALFDIAEEAKAHLFKFSDAHNIEIDFMPGQLSVAHKKRFVDTYLSHAQNMHERFGYNHISFMDKSETDARLGSKRYFGGIRDMGTGHINALKLLLGTAKAANAVGAKLYEQTSALKITPVSNGVEVETDKGTIYAKHCLIATNAYSHDLERQTNRHIMPIISFIGATKPLGAQTPILPGGESVDDSRFVVRYFRKSKDGCLLFGGSEAYTKSGFLGMKQQIKRQLIEIYPDLEKTALTHAWGGYVGITIPRMPFIREVMPNVMSIGGYSGHGIILANFMGKLYAEMLSGNREKLRLFEDLNIPSFPGGDFLRPAILTLAMNWYALRDRF